MLQQYLPLAVLKHYSYFLYIQKITVATVLTACGIETILFSNFNNISLWVATVLTACGIETDNISRYRGYYPHDCCNSTYRLRY